MDLSVALPLSQPVFHATHWKAGSQWIYKILRELQPQRIVAPQVGERQLFIDPLVAGAIYPSCYATREQLALRVSPESRLAFAVLRDLRDTLVSAYFSMRYSHAIEAAWMGQLRAELETLSEEDGLLLLLERWLPGCAAIHASWLGSGELVITYEQLLEDDQAVLSELLVDRLGLPLARAEVRTCVAANRFSALAGGRARGQENVQHHQRKGTAGDWTNHFTPRIAERFDALYGSLADCYLRAPASLADGGSRPGPLRRFWGGLAAPRPTAAAAAPALITVRSLQREELRAAYELVSTLHPNIPSYTLWMAWELAAFRCHALRGKVLDLGCQDARLAALALDHAEQVLGMCSDAAQAEAATQQGGYREVLGPAQLAEPAWQGAFDSIYARGAISVCDDLQATLALARHALRPGGTMVCSVLTTRFGIESGVSGCLQAIGQSALAGKLHRDYLEYHHVRHLHEQQAWVAAFAQAGLAVTSVTPILPGFSFRMFSLIDELWHSPDPAGTPLGVPMAARLSALPGFRDGFRSVIEGLAEIDGQQGAPAALVLKATAV